MKAPTKITPDKTFYFDKAFYFDSTDPKLIRDLIEKYGDSETMFTGTNEEGELMTFSIDTERGIITNTYQKNGWVRVNYYDTDGYDAGETFDGRWK